jgi:hypothetical protein
MGLLRTFSERWLEKLGHIHTLTSPKDLFFGANAPVSAEDKASLPLHQSIGSDVTPRLALPGKKPGRTWLQPFTRDSNVLEVALVKTRFITAFIANDCSITLSLINIPAVPWDSQKTRA